jgi:prophage antirepressor-like protein
MGPEIIRKEIFEEVELNVVQHEGQEWFMTEDIRKALGYVEKDAIHELYRRNLDEFEGLSCTLKLRVHDKNVKLVTRLVRVFNLQAVQKFGFFANTPRAKAFRHWASHMLTSGMEKMRAAVNQYQAQIEDLKRKSASLASSLSKAKKQLAAAQQPLALPASADPDKIPVSRQDLQRLYNQIHTKNPNSVYQAERTVKAIIDGRPLPKDNYPCAHILDDDNLRDSSVWNLVQGIKEGKQSRDLSGLAEAALQELDTTAWVMWHSRRLYQAIVLQTIIHSEEFIIRARQ